MGTYYKLLAEFLLQESYLMLLPKMRPLNRHLWGISDAMTLKDSRHFLPKASYLSSYPF
jgi:hypothetical protein